MAVDLEEVAQLPAVVGAAEAVGAQHPVARRHKGADLVGEHPDVVGGGDHRPLPAAEALLDPALARRLGRVQQVPALGVDRVAAELGEAGHAPDVRGHAPIVAQQVGGGDHLAQDGAAAQELHARPRLPRPLAFSPACNRYMPLTMPSSAPSGIAGCS